MIITILENLIKLIKSPTVIKPPTIIKPSNCN